LGEIFTQCINELNFDWRREVCPIKFPL